MHVLILRARTYYIYIIKSTNNVNTLHEFSKRLECNFSEQHSINKAFLQYSSQEDHSYKS